MCQRAVLTTKLYVHTQVKVAGMILLNVIGVTAIGLTVLAKLLTNST